MNPTSPTAARCSIARTAEDLDTVFRLRYLCYHSRGAIEERADGRFCDRYDELPNQFSILYRNEERDAVASVRLSVVRPDLGWTESPAGAAFGDHAAYRSMAAASMVEASRLCFARTARRDAFYSLLGHMTALAEHFEAEWLAACPRVEHSEIYQRLYGFQPTGAVRRYTGVRFQTELLGTRLADIRELAGRVPWMDRAWEAARPNAGGISTIFSLQYIESTVSPKTIV